LLSKQRLLPGWVIARFAPGKPSQYAANTKVNSAFYPSWPGKSSTGLLGWD